LTSLVPALGAWPTHFLGWSARAAVVVFFCLSGFVITSSIREATRQRKFALTDFALRRVARIYPPYLLAIVISWLASLYLARTELRSSTEVAIEITRSLLFLNGGQDIVTAMDGPLWSLRLEVIAYAVAGLLAFALTNWRTARVHAGIVLVVALILAFVTPFVLTFGLSSLTWFAFGAIAARYRGALIRCRFVWLGALTLFVLGIPLTASSLWAIGAADTLPAMGFQAVFAALVASWIAALSADEMTSLSAFHQLGSFAYTLYVIHFPILLVLVKVLRDSVAPSNVTSNVGVAIFLVLGIFLAVEALAFCLGKFAERPRFFHSLLTTRLGLIRAAATRLSLFGR
jgi:peptidoglycan/LPS O-acetylase OafA/YrhL